MQPFIVIDHLEKSIDDFKLGPIELTIHPGTITALVGNNGSGKSTLLKLIMDLIKPDIGNIRLFGQSTYDTEESWKANIAYLPQTAIGFDPYTGNTLKKLISNWYPNWDDNLFIEMVRQFDIPLDKKFFKLSQGAQQKLLLALTLPRNASLLILDEPTNFIDIPSKKIFIDFLANWMDGGERSIIMASHQIEDIKKLADYLLIMRNGEVIGNYEKETLTENYRRYWLKENTQLNGHIPGEIARTGIQLISNNAEATEDYFNENSIFWNDRHALELDEIITLLLRH